MKKLVFDIRNFSFFFLIVFLLFASCKKDDDMQETPDTPDAADVPETVENPPAQSVDPNQATASLIFDNMKVVSGSPPESKPGEHKCK